MYIHINQTDGTPIYLQIVNQIKYLIASRGLQPGDELLPIRVLAEQLLINPNTVARAYRELQVAGLVEKRGTAGTFVAAGSSPLARDAQLNILQQRIDTLLSDARHMGVSVKELKDLMDKRQKYLEVVPTDPATKTATTISEKIKEG